MSRWMTQERKYYINKPIFMNDLWMSQRFTVVERGCYTRSGCFTELQGGIPLESSPDPATGPGWTQETNPLKPTWLPLHSTNPLLLSQIRFRGCYSHHKWLAAGCHTGMRLHTVRVTALKMCTEEVCWSSTCHQVLLHHLLTVTMYSHLNVIWF